MKKLNTILAGGIAAAAQIAQASNEVALPLKDLNQIGVNPEAVEEAYREQANVKIDWNEILKVSADDEGKNINVHTINGISVVVPIYSASGPFNKGDALRD
jgi:hypothetical protein